MPVNSRPAVVFVDLGMMLSFDQLASVLRERGVHTVHLSQASNFLAHLSSRVVYDESHTFHHPAEIVDLLATHRERIADVQCPESLLGAVLEAARAADLRAPVVAMLEERVLWRDKRSASRRLAAAGVEVPQEIALTGQVHTPVVVKRRVGSGGEGVRIVRESRVLPAVIEELGGPDEVHGEALAPGATWCWAGCVVDGRVMDDVVYRTRQAHAAEGPSTHSEVVDRPDIAAVGSRVASLLSTPGLLNLDLVLDSDGTPLVVDVNLRAWHSVVALRERGHDFASTYLEALGLLPRGAAATGGGTSGPVRVFPDQSADDTHEPRSHAIRRFVADGRAQGHFLPWRYIAAQTVLFARRVAQPRGSNRSSSD